MDIKNDVFERLEKRLDKVEDKVEDKFDNLNKTLFEVSSFLVRLEASHDLQEEIQQKMSNTLTTVDSRLDTYNSSLQEHMRRTALLESKLETLEVKKVDPLYAAFTQDQAEKIFIENKKSSFMKNVKIIGAVAATIGSLITLYRYFG